jgi:hypothetical protein
MAEVKINRELLSSVVDDLDEYHLKCDCTAERPCPTRQRLGRLRGLLLRNPVTT